MMKKVLAAVCLVFAFGGGLHATPPQSPKETKSRATPVQIGDSAPDFTLTDLNGATVTLSAVRKKRPTVLVFYRGYW